MRRVSYRELREHLAVMARLPLMTRAERYLRQQCQDAASARPAKNTPKKRRERVRVYTITLKSAAGGQSVPHLRMSGRWLERYGFGNRTRVFVHIEPGRLVLTTTDPAIATNAEERG